MATYLTFTQGTPTSNKKFTFSTWLKRGDIETDNVPFYCGSGSELDLGFMFSDAGPGNIRANWDATASEWLVTNRVFRDPGAWYHIVFAVDTSLASSGDRLRLYINGVEETSFSSESQPSQDATSAALASGQLITLGRNEYSDAKYFLGVMAHTHFIDGTQYAASAFGETDATSGIWVAKTSPSVTYGNNGFFLKYASGALGTDSSGNGNNLVVSGTMTNTKDTPDNNFATWNPLYNSNVQTFSNGNTTLSGTQSANYSARSASTLCMFSGKWYAEFKVLYGATNMAVGVGNIITDGTNAGADSNPTTAANAVSLASGNLYNNGVETSSYYTAADGDIYGIAVDKDNDKVYFSQNGTWLNSSDPAAGTNPASTGLTYDATFLGRSLAGSWKANFGNGYFGTTAVSTGNADAAGNGTFEYAVPTGYYALCTNNLGDQS